MKYVAIIGVVVLIVLGVGYWYISSRSPQKTTEQTPTTEQKEQLSPQPKISELPGPGLVVEPVKEFYQRATKKLYGTYITPENSPVQPERFRGYHTGVDIEFDDVKDDVPVVAIADGVVKRSGTASGYGGLVVIEHVIDGDTYLAIYGHLDPKTLPKLGASVRKDDQIGILGDGYTSETDSERKHLHFGLHKGSDINIKGYVSDQKDLDNWVDPSAFLRAYSGNPS